MEGQNLFTGVPDMDREILLRIPNDNNLFKACSISKYSQTLCNEYFWKQRFTRKYGLDLDKCNIENYQQLYKMSKDKALIYAASIGCLKIIKKMLKKGANINANRDSALIKAVQQDNLQIVNYLIKHGANVNVGEDSPLILAASKGYLAVVKYLVENGVGVGPYNYLSPHYAVKEASKNGHLNVVEYLVEKYGNIYAEDKEDLRLAIENGHVDVAKYLINTIYKNNNYTQNEALIEAAEFDQFELVKFLVENKVGARGDALIAAAKWDNLEIVKYLIQHGANIHVQHDKPLITAVKHGHLEVVKYLIEHGANVQTKKDKLLKLAVNNSKKITTYLSGNHS